MAIELTLKKTPKGYADVPTTGEKISARPWLARTVISAGFALVAASVLHYSAPTLEPDVRLSEVLNNKEKCDHYKRFVHPTRGIITLIEVDVNTLAGEPAATRKQIYEVCTPKPRGQVLGG